MANKSIHQLAEEIVALEAACVEHGATAKRSVELVEEQITKWYNAEREEVRFAVVTQLGIKP